MQLASFDERLAERVAERPDAVRAVVNTYRERCARLGIPPLAGASLPLRPFFLSPRQVRVLTEGLGLLFERLGSLTPAVLLPGADPVAINLWDRHRRSPAFWHLMRPDTIFHDGEPSLIDLNLGTAAAVTCFETDLLAGFYRELFAALDLDPAPLEPALDGSVLEGQCRSLRRHLPRFDRIAALLQPTDSLEDQLALFGGQLAGYLEQLEQILGVEVLLTSPEDGLASGLLASPGTLIFQLGMIDLAVPARRVALAPLLELPGVERRWVSSPFTSLYEKNLLPLLASRGLGQLAVPATVPVRVVDVDDLVRRREHLVLKHGRNLKRVLVGAQTPPELWRDAVVLSAHIGEYLAQERVVPMVERIPVLLGERIAHVDVSPEFSPFVVDGELSAVFVRYLPLGSSSAVVSPPPVDLGLGVAWAVTG